jgi:formylglycine-generating enzyme required for sulfatase activity
MPEKKNTQKPTPESVTAGTVAFPDSVALIGSKLEYIPKFLRELDQQKHLCIGNLLDPTPQHWMRIRPFAIGKRLVTNGEYLKFVQARLENVDEGESEFFYDDPELWRMVWEDLNLQITQTTMAVLAEEGEVVEHEEVYHNAINALDAYLISLRMEMERLLLLQTGVYSRESTTTSGTQAIGFLKRPGKKTQRFEFTREKRLARLFSLIRLKLCKSIFQAPELETGLEDDMIAESKDQYDDLAAVVGDIDYLLKNLRDQYLRAIDEQYRQAFIQNRHPVETMQFLQRFKLAIKKHKTLTDSVSAHDVFYPRYWQRPGGEQARSAIRGHRVPWENLPITGITLYEAAAYTVWLSETTGLEVSLPSEFEYERASSWGPKNGRIDPASDKKLIVDPCRKGVLPWESTKDFNFYFGREGAINASKQKEYARLLSATGRKINGKSIDQLLGFGWQWTLDRFNESERKYNRFENPNYPVFTDIEVACAGKEDEPLTVYEYEPYRSLESAFFVLRGSPDVIGGAGLTTRRFAVFPLRGYRNISFRIVIRPEDAGGEGL